MKIPSFYYFLNAPELKLPSEQFPFASFSTSKITTEMFTLDFPANRMLGKQAEFMFESWLKQSQRFQIIVANIQIQGATETLGELDYIIQEAETNTILHVELACKFYLLDKTLGKEVSAQWIGPNRKDRLADKLKKMKIQQFPLLYKEETASRLHELQIAILDIHQRYCLKAFLFVPKGFQQQNLPMHFQDCLAGYYVSWTQVRTEEDTTAVYALPKKKEWLLPPENLKDWLLFSEAHKQINTSIAEKRSPLVYKKINGLIEKFFVVWWD